MSSRLLPRGVPLAALAVALLAACSDSISAPRLTSPPATGNAAAVSSGLTVTSTSPSDAPRDTTLNVQVNGSGFARGAQATFSLAGVVDPRVRVNSTTYVKSSQVIANVTIAADADVGKYDAVVTNADGKKGIGTEMFEVTLRAEALPNGTHVLGVDEFGNAVGRASSSATCPSPVLPILWRADGTRVELPLGSFCGGTAG